MSPKEGRPLPPDGLGLELRCHLSSGSPARPADLGFASLHNRTSPEINLCLCTYTHTRTRAHILLVLSLWGARTTTDPNKSTPGSGFFNTTSRWVGRAVLSCSVCFRGSEGTGLLFLSTPIRALWWWYSTPGPA